MLESNWQDVLRKYKYTEEEISSIPSNPINPYTKSQMEVKDLLYFYPHLNKIEPVWETEPDYEEEIYRGWQYQLKRMWTLNMNGYVLPPTGGEFSKKQLKQLKELEVHGGLTLLKSDRIGFDTAHTFIDLVPKMFMEFYKSGDFDRLKERPLSSVTRTTDKMINGEMYSTKVFRTIDYVREETFHLIDQIVDLQLHFSIEE